MKEEAESAKDARSYYNQRISDAKRSERETAQISFDMAEQVGLMQCV